MRGYLGVTSQEVAQFLKDGSLEVAEIYAPTQTFLANSADLDEEEVEFTLTMLAVEEALEVKDESTGAACVLAFEIPDEAIAAQSDVTISLSSPLSWGNLECLFEVSADGEDLTWFATQEIASHIEELLAK